jgi:RNA-binding protein
MKENKENHDLITSKMKRRMRKELNAEKPTIWVGKEGATTQIINEINRQLEQREVIKAKILQTALKTKQAKTIAAMVSRQTGSTLIDLRGHTLILYKKRKRK